MMTYTYYADIMRNIYVFQHLFKLVLAMKTVYNFERKKMQTEIHCTNDDLDKIPG